MSIQAEKALERGPLSKAVREWGFEQNFEGNPALHWAARQGTKIESFFSDSLIEKIHLEKPDILVATQAPTTDLLSYWKEKGLIHQPRHAVVTDFGAHQIWQQDAVDRYYVASDATQQDLMRFGVDQSHISVTGIPIRPAFASPPQDRTEAKKKLGLDPGKPLVLLLGGALGSVNFNRTAKALDALPNDFQAAAICGRNEEARKALEEDTFSHKFHALGFVNDMVDWLDACDLIVSKPGGLSSSEILARGRAILIYDPIPGLEMKNARRLTAAGVGQWARDFSELPVLAGKLLDNPAEREVMEKAALAVGRPDAAAAAARQILAAAWENRDFYKVSG
jgi:processive 1,2-diacylglycerol beta-glucosyltransferase